MGTGFLKDLEHRRPDAILIDLSRLPSQGRDLAIAIRNRKRTRSIPIIFLEGDPAKVERIRKLLPDAIYGRWSDVARLIDRAQALDMSAVHVPGSAFAAYAGRPLAAKLGIKPGSSVGHVNAPGDALSALRHLPPGASLKPMTDGPVDLALWFARSAVQLDKDMRRIVAAARQAPVWIAWPKKAFSIPSNLTQQRVRKAAMDAGLVDYKICSITKDWSGLLFKYRGNPADSD